MNSKNYFKIFSFIMLGLSIVLAVFIAVILWEALFTDSFSEAWDRYVAIHIFLFPILALASILTYLLTINAMCTFSHKARTLFSILFSTFVCYFFANLPFTEAPTPIYISVLLSCGVLIMFFVFAGVTIYTLCTTAKRQPK